MRATRKTRFITPALGELLFWILAASIAIGGLLSAAAAPVAIVVGIALIVALRVAFELVLVIFACHEELERIRTQLEAHAAPATPMAASTATRPTPVSPLAAEQAAKAARAKELADKLERARQLDRQREAGRPPPAPGEHRLE